MLYENLSQDERRAAIQFAQELLRTVPATQKPLSERPCLFMQPENVVGAFVYPDCTGNWEGVVVVKKGKHCFEYCSREELRSREDALEHVKDMIASIKGNVEHPIVQELRDKDIDLQQVELLRVKHEKFGHRWVILDDDQIWMGAAAFVAYVDDKFAGEVDKLEHARTVILEMAPQFAAHPLLLRPADDNDEQEGAIQLLYDAAAFLLSNGIMNVDQDTTETDFGLPNSETISQRPTLH